MGTYLFIVPFAKSVRLPSRVCDSGLTSSVPPQQFGRIELFRNSDVDLLVSDVGLGGQLVVGDCRINY
jgi:hypothetical protein